MADKLQVKNNPAKSDILKPTVPSVKEYVSNTDRRYEDSSVSSDGSSISVRDGNVNISSNLSTQFKVNNNGTIESISMKNIVNTNRETINADEIIINNHTLNNKIFEYTDFKQVTTQVNSTGIIGNFCMTGTVLVKAWEPELKRYVFIRRIIRMPMFSPDIKTPDILPGLKLTDPTKTTVSIAAVMDTASTTTTATDKNNVKK